MTAPFDAGHCARISASLRGHKVSAETKAKLSKAKLGRKLSPGTLARIAVTKERNGSVPSGPDHYNWKGGRPWERFKDPEYIAWRNAVLSRDGYVCQKCQRQCKKHERGLAAHHIKPYASHPELRFDIANGQTLCRKCHMLVHGKEIKTEMIPCGCGCGTIIASADPYGRPRQFVNGHGKRKQLLLAI